MKKSVLLLCVFSLICVSFSGCRQKHTEASLHRTVTQIDIVTNHNGALLRRHYRDPEKMQYVLTFLRLLKSVGNPDVNPEYLTEDMFLIALTRSDGSRVYYRQTGHRYACKNDENWFSIDPEQALTLYELMAHIPSDPTHNETLFFAPDFTQ